MDLYLIRHTPTSAPAGLCYGRLDVPLAPGSAEDCRAVAARLPAVEAVWTSPLARSLALAREIAARSRLTPAADERLAELAFGAWEGRPWEAIDRRESDLWAADYWNVAPPGGETSRELHERVGRALMDFVARHHERAAVVTHAGPIRAALAQCLTLEPTRYHAVPLAYGGITLLRGEPGAWHLERLDG